MREIDEFSRTVGAMSCFNEMIATGCKNLALGAPVSDVRLRDEHMEHAKLICEKKGTQCCNEDGGFLTDLFPVSMNKDKFNILFYSDIKYRDEYFAMKTRKEKLVAQGHYDSKERRKLAYDFGKLLSYSDEAIERMLANNDELEVF
ncbi:MAG: hypothetical protein RR232_08125 [Clostridia bacterium]